MLAPALAALLTVHAPAASGLSTASQLSVEGLATLSSAGAELIAGASQLTVDAIETGAHGVVLVLRASAETGSSAVRLPLETLGGISLAVGQTVEVVTLSAGAALVVAGEVLTFVPNALAARLIHHQVHR